MLSTVRWGRRQPLGGAAVYGRRDNSDVMRIDRSDGEAQRIGMMGTDEQQPLL